MLRLTLKVITVSLSYSIIAQILKTMYPMFPQPTLLIGVLIVLVTGSVGSYFYGRINRSEFYLLLFWLTVGAILGLS